MRTSVHTGRLWRERKRKNWEFEKKWMLKKEKEWRMKGTNADRLFSPTLLKPIR